MHHTRILSVLLALAASASTLRAEVVPILSDTAGAVKDGATTLTKTGGSAKTLAISPKSTAFIRFAAGDTGILPSEVGAARLIIYFAAVTKPGSVSFHNVTSAFTESFPEKSKPAPAFDVPFASVTAVKGQYLTLDVTAQVVTWLATPTPAGFGVAITADGTTAALLASKEGAGSGHPAVLEIDLASSTVTMGVDLANAATSANTAGTIMRRDGSGNVTVGTITGNLAGNANTATTAGSATNFTGALAGEVTGPQGATVVVSVGSVTAANVAAASGLANAATNLNTAGTIVQRDASGNFTAGTITGSLAGNATSATTATTAGSFTDALAGNVTGTQGATLVATVGGVTAANVAAGANLANAATTANTPNTIVKRDGSGTIPASAVATAPAGMAFIPSGTFTMGRNIGDTDSDAVPTDTTVAAFYMDVNEVTLSQWQAVQQWATLVGGYTDMVVGSGKGATHPVQTVSWYECVKWCNARSEREGKTPVYYTDDAQTTVYRTENLSVTNAQVKWPANGYRLPTEAEWEEGGAGRLGRETVSVGQHDLAETGELQWCHRHLCLRFGTERLQSNRECWGNLTRDEPSGLVCGERLWVE